ncbi:hypothetical protein [Nicoliella lavandulae]|uniref:DNA-binding protein n=1 Tax=Nicoliella lavandulae TaxID=3082954 RepID=A0ABU8SJ65_9LACO
MITLLPVADWDEAKKNYDHCMTDDEIAFLHGISVNTVKVYRNRHGWGNANHVKRKYWNTKSNRELFQVDELPSGTVIASLFSQRKVEIQAKKYRAYQRKLKRKHKISLRNS